MCRKLILFVGILLLIPGLSRSQETPSFFKAIVRIKATVPETARTAESLGIEREGSGVVIDKKGHVLTIGYLVIEADRITVTDKNGKNLPAIFVGYDHRTGFGLIRTLVPTDIEPMQLGRSATIGEGELIMVASHRGAETARGARVVSRKAFAGYWEYLLEDAIFTSPPFSDYGGAALLDSSGRLLGIGSLYTRLNVTGIGVIPCNMFVPIDRLKPILKDLIANGRPSEPPQPWLGLHADENYGRVIVMQVTEGSPADKSGLNVGDIILSVQGKDIAGLADFYRKVWALGPAGVSVPLRVLQGSAISEVVIQSADRSQFLNLKPRDRGI
jgi:S1-C subfamily serine protease